MSGEIEIEKPRMMADGGVELSACLRIGVRRWKQYLRVRGAFSILIGWTTAEMYGPCCFCIK